MAGGTNRTHVNGGPAEIPMSILMNQNGSRHWPQVRRFFPHPPVHHAITNDYNQCLNTVIGKFIEEQVGHVFHVLIDRYKSWSVNYPLKRIPEIVKGK